MDGQPIGVVVLDANTIRHLLKQHQREHFFRCLRVADAEVWPNAIGVLELLQTPEPQRRSQLLGSLAAICQNQSVQPLPSEVLRLTGQMLADGAVGFDWPNSGFESVLYRPDEISDEHISAARGALQNERETFEELHRRARRHLRPLLSDRSLREGSVSLGDFLDQIWVQPPIAEAFIQIQWNALGLPGAPDARALIRNDAWRLSLEGFGASIYERSIMNKSPRPVQSADIRQLIYLAGSHHATMVTDDKPLQRVANGIIAGRYQDLRVMSLSQFLSLAT